MPGHYLRQSWDHGAEQNVVVGLITKIDLIDYLARRSSKP